MSSVGDGPWPIPPIGIERGQPGWHEAFVADCIRRAFPVPVREPVAVGDRQVDVDGRPLVVDETYTSCRVAFQRAEPGDSAAIPAGTQLAIITLRGEERETGFSGYSAPTSRWYSIDIRTQGNESTLSVIDASERVLRCLTRYTLQVMAHYDPEDDQQAGEVGYKSRIIELELAALPA